jgi:hypothetical protein
VEGRRRGAAGRTGEKRSGVGGGRWSVERSESSKSVISGVWEAGNPARLLGLMNNAG